MTFDDALRRYREGVFTDDDVTRCTGLSVRAWRELIKIGAVRTTTEGRGRGRVRLCDANTFKRGAVIAALNQAGFSLAMSGRIAYFLPLDELLYAIWDPCLVLLDESKTVDPKTGLPPRVKKPKADWFDPDRPAKADPETDWSLEIYEGRFVGVIYQAEDEPMIYGELRNAGTHFVCWYPAHRETQITSATEEIARALLPYKPGQPVPKWAHPGAFHNRISESFLDFEYEDHDAGDPLSVLADEVARNAVFKVTINATLAVRKALRIYLGIDRDIPGEVA